MDLFDKEEKMITGSSVFSTQLLTDEKLNKVAGGVGECEDDQEPNGSDMGSLLTVNGREMGFIGFKRYR